MEEVEVVAPVPADNEKRHDPQQVEDEDRETRRAAMWANPEWLTYVKKSAELGALEKQENILMNNVSFWDPRA